MSDYLSIGRTRALYAVSFIEVGASFKVLRKHHSLNIVALKIMLMRLFHRKCDDKCTRKIFKSRYIFQEAFIRAAREDRWVVLFSKPHEYMLCEVWRHMPFVAPVRYILEEVVEH